MFGALKVTEANAAHVLLTDPESGERELITLVDGSIFALFSTLFFEINCGRTNCEGSSTTNWLRGDGAQDTSAGECISGLHQHCI